MNEFFSSSKDLFVKNILKNIIEKNYETIIKNYDLSQWKEAAVLCLTNNLDNLTKFQNVMNILSEQLIKEKFPEQQIFICYVLARNIQEIIQICFDNLEKIGENNELQRKKYIIKTVEKIIMLIKIGNYPQLTDACQKHFELFLEEFSKIAIQEEQYLLAYKILSFVEKASKNIAVLKDLLYSQEEINYVFAQEPPKPFKIEQISTLIKLSKTYEYLGTKKPDQPRQNQKKTQPQNYFQNEPTQSFAQQQKVANQQRPIVSQQQTKGVQAPLQKQQQQQLFREPPKQQEEIQDASKQQNVKKSPFGQPFGEDKHPMTSEAQNQQQQQQQSYQQSAFPIKKNIPPPPTPPKQEQTSIIQQNQSAQMAAPNQLGQSQAKAYQPPPFKQPITQPLPFAQENQQTSFPSQQQQQQFPQKQEQFKQKASNVPPPPKPIFQQQQQQQISHQPVQRNIQNVQQMQQQNIVAQPTPQIPQIPQGMQKKVEQQMQQNDNEQKLSIQEKEAIIYIVKKYSNRLQIIEQNQRKRMNLEKTLEQLLNMIQQDQIQYKTGQLLHQLCQNVDSDNVTQALNIHKEICLSDFQQNKDWLNTMKRIIMRK